MTWPLLVALFITTTTPEPPSLQHALAVNGALSGTDSHGAVTYRLRTADGWQLGVDLQLAAPRESYISGYPTKGGIAPSGMLIGVAPLVEAGPLQLSLTLQVGARFLFADASVGPDTRSVSLLTRLGPIASVRLNDVFALRSGWHTIVNVQLSPEPELEALGQVLLLGVVAQLSPEFSITADFETGGLFGFEGDGSKYLVRGTLGLRWTIGGGARWSTF